MMKTMMKPMIRSMLETVLAGESDAEISGGENYEFEVSANRGRVAEYCKAQTGAWTVRALDGRRLGTAYTEKSDAPALAAAIAAAKRNARFMDEDEGNGLCEAGGAAIYDIGAESGWLDDEAAKRQALELEALCKAQDSRIVNVPRAGCGSGSTLTIVATGRGRYREAELRYAFAYAQVIASDGEATETGMRFQFVRDPRQIDIAALARAVAAQAVDLLGGAEPASGAYRCVLSNEAASGLIGAFLGNFSAEAMQKGVSKLAGRQGQKIASAEFSLVDDPAALGFGKRPFDDEGVDAAALTIIDRGVFTETLHTIYSARRAGERPNGRAFRASAKARPAAALINGFVPNGAATPATLLANVGRGILVTELHGLHAGLNVISGDFSCSAKGFAIEGGIRGGPLRNFTISGNFYELLDRIAARADDRRTDLHASFSSPSLLVESLAVSGR